MFVTLLIILLGAASLLVWAEIVQRWWQNQPVLEAVPRCSSPWLPLASVVAGVYIILLAVTSNPVEVQIEQVQQGAAFGAFEILIALVLLTGGFRTPLRDVGLRLTNLRRQVAEGTFACLASLLPVYTIMLATFWLRTLENEHAFLKLLREDPSPVNAAWMMLAAVIIAPVREELLFRVMLQDGLARRIGAAPAIGIVAVLFCLVHGFPDSLALFPLALILGYVYHQRQSAVAVIVTHALFNLANLVVLLLSPEVSP